MWSAGTREELRSSRSDVARRSAPFRLIWPSWLDLPPPYDPDDDPVPQAVVMMVILVLCMATLLPGLAREPVNA